jgi:hypothetical protein
LLIGYLLKYSFSHHHFAQSSIDKNCKTVFQGASQALKARLVVFELNGKLLKADEQIVV